MVPKYQNSSPPAETEWQGTGDAVAALAGDRLSACGARTRSAFALPRSNRHLHHCHHAGEQAIPALRQSKRRFGHLTSPEPATHPLHRTDSTVRSIEGGFFTACGVKYPKSSPPAFREPQTRQAKLQNEYCRDALKHGASPKRTLQRFALPSVDRDRSRRSLRQAPRLARARFRANPGIRVSRFRLSPECFRTSGAPENKKPSGAAAREGS